MIEVLVPFALLLMSWDERDPAGSMTVQQRVFVDHSTCLAAGRDVDRVREHSPGQGFAWRCVPQQQGIEAFRAGPGAE